MARQAGWYPDDRFPEDERYWDGEAWGASRPVGHASPAIGVDASDRHTLKGLAIGVAVGVIIFFGFWWVVSGDRQEQLAAEPTQSGAGFTVSVGQGAAPASFNGCRLVSVVWNTRLAPAERPLVEGALGQLAAATGLTFIDGGTTMLVPGDEGEVMPETSRPETPLVIAFDTKGGPDQSTYFRESPDAIGVGGWRASVGLIDQSFVVIDVGALRELSEREKVSLYLHELRHAVGLGHVNEPGEVMYPQIGEKSPDAYATGDVNGLRQVVQADC